VVVAILFRGNDIQVKGQSQAAASSPSLCFSQHAEL
jgi:hypothetical protein